MIEPREQIDKKAMLLLSLNEGKFISESSSKKAQEALSNLDFPTRKTEDWKYTRTNKIASGQWTINAAEFSDISKYEIEGLDCHKIVLINGVFQEEISSISSQEGITISSIKEAQNIDALGFDSLTNNESIFTPLNTAFAHGGAFLHIQKNVQLEKPLHIINLSQGENTGAQTRNFIICEPLSEAKIIESFYSDDKVSFANTVSEMIVKDGAKLSYDKIQYRSLNHHHVASEFIYQEKNSTFSINTITLNGGWVRNGLNIVVDGENCETYLNGLYLLKDNQHVDNHTLVDHKKAHCMSRELYKGIAEDNSTGVFNGKVFVRPNAQKIEAFQQNNNIVMSDTASINAKPELEIYADDVKCSHGSTTGQFDEEAVFYLRARGVSETNARKLLVSAFSNDVIEKIEIEEVKNKIYQLLEERFAWSF